jgi:hypothetical protein
MMISSSAIISHPWNSGLLLSEGEPDKGPIENPGSRVGDSKLGMACYLMEQVGHDSPDR